MKTLSYEDVLGIHHYLVNEFKHTEDPIEPNGVRENGNLLKSAVDRQNVGVGYSAKYFTVDLNAATLCFGLCCNHPFHNGNKRTALVALLCHLDKNGMTFDENVSKEELYNFMIDVASHKFSPELKHGPRADNEVVSIAKWLKRRIRRIRTGEKIVCYRELRQLLKKYNIFLESPNGGNIEVITYKELPRYVLFKSRQRVKICNIVYHGETREVPKSVLKRLRNKINKNEFHGFDSETFYSTSTNIDTFIARYRKVLTTLAKT